MSLLWLFQLLSSKVAAAFLLAMPVGESSPAYSHLLHVLGMFDKAVNLMNLVSRHSHPVSFMKRQLIQSRVSGKPTTCPANAKCLQGLGFLGEHCAF